MNYPSLHKMQVSLYTVGENVKVIDGPFNGFNGTIEKIHEDKKETGSYGSYLRKKDSTGTKLHAGRKELSS